MTDNEPNVEVKKNRTPEEAIDEAMTALKNAAHSQPKKPAEITLRIDDNIQFTFYVYDSSNVNKIVDSMMCVDWTRIQKQIGDLR